MSETRISGLYVHGERGGRPNDGRPTPMLSLQTVDLEEGRGIVQDIRYFHRGDPGRMRKRQVSVIDEGTIGRHEARFGPIERNVIKSQIILKGDVHLPDLLGLIIEFESGVKLRLSVPREPCFQMDFIHLGLRSAMQNGEQGALGMVLEGGRLSVGHRAAIPDRVEDAMAVQH